MDFAKVGTRKAAEPAIDKYRSGTPFSYCRAASYCSLSSILHRIQCDFLVADYSQEPIGTFRRAGRPPRRRALRCGALCDALQRMAFRQKSRKTLARCGPTLDRRNRIAVPHQSAQLECNVGFTVERHLHGHGISAGVLGDSNGNPQRLQGGSCRGNDQRACQPGRFCRTVRVRISPR